MIKKINLNCFDTASLNVGDRVLLSGKILTGRDAAHKQLQELSENSKPFPIDLEGRTIYYVGACPPKQGDVIGSCGPTTASRMDFFTPHLLSLGLKGIIAKGKRSHEVETAIKEHGAVYFGAIGGAGAYYADCVKSHKIICFKELLSEAICEMEIVDFPAIVLIV